MPARDTRAAPVSVRSTARVFASEAKPSPSQLLRSDGVVQPERRRTRGDERRAADRDRAAAAAVVAVIPRTTKTADPDAAQNPAITRGRSATRTPASISTSRRQRASGASTASSARSPAVADRGIAPGAHGHDHSPPGFVGGSQVVRSTSAGAQARSPQRQRKPRWAYSTARRAAPRSRSSSTASARPRSEPGEAARPADDMPGAVRAGLRLGEPADRVHRRAKGRSSSTSRRRARSPSTRRPAGAVNHRSARTSRPTAQPPSTSRRSTSRRSTSRRSKPPVDKPPVDKAAGRDRGTGSPRLASRRATSHRQRPVSTLARGIKLRWAATASR